MTIFTLVRFENLQTVRRVCLLLALAAICGWCDRAVAEDLPGKDYPIRLSFPSKLKDRYKLVGSATQEITTVPTNPANANVKPAVEAIAVEYEAICETLAIDSKGAPTKFSFTIGKLLRTDVKPPGIILPAGAVVIVDGSALNSDKPEETGFTLENGKLTPEQLEALFMVINPQKPEVPTDDECYGIESKQKVGASWPINVAKAIKQPILDGWSSSPEHTKGTMTLVGVDLINGTEWMKTRLEVSSDKFQGPAIQGQTTEKANLQIQLISTMPLPVNSLDGTLMSDTKTEFFTNNVAADGTKFPTKTTTKYHGEFRSTVLPAAQ